MPTKQSQFNKILGDIKSIKIQGARNVAEAGFRAYEISPTSSAKKKILATRPTEPMLANVLKLADNFSYSKLKEKLDNNQEIINKQTFKLIKNNSVIFTHCHSSAVIKALIYCKKKGKRFEVYNTETRPLYQGRKTAKELKKTRIKVTMFVDSAASIALNKEQGTKKVSLVLLGADAILKTGVINKVGSEMISQIAKDNKIPVYILSDSLKYSSKKPEIEQRNFKEIWNTEKKIKIKNPAFELINKKFVTGIISDFGKQTYSQFLRKVRG